MPLPAKADAHSDPAKTAEVPLRDVMSALVRSFVAAQHAMDQYSCELSQDYLTKEALNAARLPFFGFADITVKLRCAIRNLSDAGDLTVSIDAARISTLPETVISQLEINLTPELIKSYERSEEGAGGSMASTEGVA